MAIVVYTAPGGPQGGNLPVGCQFGNKLFICYPDLRPFYLLNSLTSFGVKAYLSGIKPPVFYPSVTESADAAKNITFDSGSGDPDANTIFFRYAYYSSVRGIFSEPSPERAYIIPAENQKKLIVNGFFFPRDDATAQDIDTIVVGAQWGTATDCMCIYSVMSAPFTPDTLADAQVVFDFTQSDLNELGFGLLELAEFVKIPPACASVERVDERLYYIPARRKVQYDQSAVQVAKAALTGTFTLSNGSSVVDGVGTKFLTELQHNDPILVDLGQGVSELLIADFIIDDDTLILQTFYTGPDATAVTGARQFRGEAAARVTLSNDGVTNLFEDSLYRMRLTVNGQLLPPVWDVNDGNTLYLDGDVPANIDATTDFFFYAPGDTVLPSGYTNETPFNFPLSIPEGIQFIDAAPISQAVDEGQIVQTIKRGGEFAYVGLSETLLQMTVASGSFSPLAISFRPVTGNIGPVSPRSVCLDQTASISWIGEEGIASANTAGAATLSNSLNCLRFWKGGRWVDEACLPDCSMEFSRGSYGYVLGGLRINQHALSGTFLVTQDSGAVVGTGSSLLSEAKIGDVFSTDFLGQHRRILAIDDDTHMTIEAWSFSGGSVNASIGAGYWALISLQPGTDILLFDGLICTSNLLAYQNANGQTVVLGGSNYRGRVFQVLDPAALVDVPLGSSGAAASYLCSWREGWQALPDGMQSSAVRVRMMGVSAPDPTGALALSLWTSNLPQRDEADLPATAFLSKPTTADKVLWDIPLPPNCKRFAALAVEFQSNAGAVGNRPMEVTRWRIMSTQDGQ